MGEVGEFRLRRGGRRRRGPGLRCRGPARLALMPAPSAPRSCSAPRAARHAQGRSGGGDDSRDGQDPIETRATCRKRGHCLPRRGEAGGCRLRRPRRCPTSGRCRCGAARRGGVITPWNFPDRGAVLEDPRAGLCATRSCSSPPRRRSDRPGAAACSYAGLPEGCSTKGVRHWRGRRNRCCSPASRWSRSPARTRSAPDRSGRRRGKRVSSRWAENPMIVMDDADLTWRYGGRAVGRVRHQRPALHRVHLAADRAPSDGTAS